MIETNYIQALELSNRLDPDKKFMWYLKNVASQTSTLTLYIRKQSTETGKYQQGLALFKEFVVESDLRVLVNMLQLYIQAYENSYRRDRLKAIRHVNNIISVSEDIVNEFSRAPSNFTNEDNAVEFYTSLYTLLSNGLTSVRMSQFYLSQALKKEDAAMKNTSLRYVPQIFYANDKKLGCTSTYEKFIQNFANLGPRWRFAAQQVFFWLQNKSANCISNNLTMTEQVVGIIPGLWNLLSCSNYSHDNLLKTDWITIMSEITQNDAVSLTDCLLSYERVLYDLGGETWKQVPKAPEMFITSALSSALLTLDNDVKAFNKEVYNYLVDVTSKAILTSRTSILLQNMSVDTEVALQSLSDILTSWQNNISTWQTNISTIYTNAINGLLKFKDFFLQLDTDLASAVSKFNIWMKPVIVLQPNVMIKNTVVNQNFTKNSIEQDIVNYLKNTAQATMFSVLNNLLTTIVTMGQLLVSQAQLMSSSWTDTKTNLNYLLEDFTSSMILDEAFMQ